MTGDPFSEAAYGALAQFLTEWFNGVDCPPGQETVGFMLVTFRLGQEEDYACLSNLGVDGVKALINILNTDGATYTFGDIP